MQKAMKRKRGGWKERGKGNAIETVWFGDALKAVRFGSSEPSRTVEEAHPKQKEEDTQRLGRRQEGLGSGGKNSSWAKSGQRAMVSHKTLPMFQPHVHSGLTPSQCPIEPIQSPVQVSGPRMTLHLSFGPTLTGR